jgi:hypothetical protein
LIGFLLRRFFQKFALQPPVCWRISASKWPCVWPLTRTLRVKPAVKRAAQSATGAANVSKLLSD